MSRTPTDSPSSSSSRATSSPTIWSRSTVTTSERVYLLDVNVLVALTHRGHVHHGAAHAWRTRLRGSDRLATTPMTESGFIRLMLNPDVAGQELNGQTVLAVLRSIRSRPEHRFLADDSSLAGPGIELSALVVPRQ